MNWRNWFGWSDDTLVEVYRAGLREGMEIQARAERLYERALACRSFPDQSHPNVYSIRAAALRRAQYTAQGPAA